MVNIEKRGLDDLTSEEREALEEQYVDATSAILEVMKKEVEFDGRNAGWALDSAVESAKGIPDNTLSYVRPVFVNPAIYGPFSDMLDIALEHLRVDYKLAEPPKATEELLNYACDARILAKHAKLSTGDVLSDIMVNEDVMTKDQVYDKANEILLDCCLKKVNKVKVDALLADAGRALTAYGIKNLREYPKYERFKKAAVELAHAKSIYRTPEPS